MDAIVLFGDSITEDPNGLTSLLSVDYVRRLDILNRGFAGYNTRWAIPIFQQLFSSTPTPRIRLITIWFGANDACLPGCRQHVPLDEYASNTRKLIEFVRKRDERTKIILITPPPIDEVKWEERRFEVTEAYAEATRKVAKEEDVALLDAYTALWEASGRTVEGMEAFFYDGLHLSRKGYELVHDALLPLLGPLHPSGLQRVYPGWDEIPPENPYPTIAPRSID